MAAITREEILRRIESRAVLAKLPTPEHHASIVEGMADADQLVWVKVGPNELHLTTRESVAPLVQSKGESETDERGANVLRIKLQKSVLMTLADDAYLVSGISYSDGTPVFSGYAGPLMDRPQLWERTVRGFSAESSALSQNASSYGANFGICMSPGVEPMCSRMQNAVMPKRRAVG